ncbi:MAG: rhombosortase [Candidatus Electrothrix sp. GW3-4]|uniref:rhombosortase n=1 Tax=Candidatus Electrothrix sp. GW3-4 TaxID=3126740 RepID=UPI0030D049B2
MTLFRNNDKHANHRQTPWFTATLCLITLLFFSIYGKAPAALIYDRTAIAHGEVWRLLTGHYTHCDLPHLLWNLLPLALIGGLLEQRIGWQRFARATIVSCLGVSSWLWFARTDMLLYCGLSGMLNGLLIVLLVRLWQETRNRALPLIGMVVIAKVLLETARQEAIFTHLSWAGLPEAHGAGLIAGIFFLMLTHGEKKRAFPHSWGAAGE